MTETRALPSRRRGTVYGPVPSRRLGYSLGVNDGPAHVARLNKVVAALRPDKVQLNTVVRPPAEPRAKPLRPSEMEKIRRALGPAAEVVADFRKGTQPPVTDEELTSAVLAMVRRRPLALDDLVCSLGRTAGEVRRGPAALEAAGKICGTKHGPRVLYEAAEPS